jgi:hypothetical protein
MEMRIAPKGKWFITSTNKTTGKKRFPFYDGFDTKKEALDVCEKLDKVTINYIHEVVKR